MIIDTEHDAVDEQLNAFLDGELDAGHRARVEAHVAACETCRRELGELQTTRSALRTLPALRAPRPFTLEAPPHRPRVWAWLPWTWRAGSLATAACLVMAWASTFPPAARFASQAAPSLSRQAPPSGASAEAPPAKVADQAAPATSLAPAAAPRQEVQRAAPSAATPQSGAGGAAAQPSPAANRDYEPGENARITLLVKAGPSRNWLAAAGVLAFLSAAALVLGRRE